MSGFQLVNRENVFRVCDQPHPLLVQEIVGHCGKARLQEAYLGMSVRHLLSSLILQHISLPWTLLTFLLVACECSWLLVKAPVMPIFQDLGRGYAAAAWCCLLCSVICFSTLTHVWHPVRLTTAMPMRQKLFNDGYSATDIITTLFRIVRNADLQEWIKLEYIKVLYPAHVLGEAWRTWCPVSVRV